MGQRPAVAATISGRVDVPAGLLDEIDLFEVRIDMLPEDARADARGFIDGLKRRYGKPVLATIRSTDEGGAVRIEDEDRYRLFEEVAPVADCMDVEISSGKLLARVNELCKKKGRLLIASFHDFVQTPSDNELRKILRAGLHASADIVKIAAKAQSREDLSRLIAFTIANRDKGLITISMGEIGLISRIVNPMIGSLITYAFIANAAAPGQLPVYEVAGFLNTFDPDFRRRNGF
ncbi:MAG: type I 3-dehydroquinate dehydratase [Nitrospiraceae bacterium]|nr:type I 3-dehydroquinate dehydratase [Nitrospiraceae bacterium]